ncbi:hypothetical protein RND81_10G146000 [Saponaria officinalis]|uniref:Uncharacterized protein n=1 Tax=Saponaria officinalis TaxID=3572 RepID=A0AAW1I4N6_SAPOF
MSNINAFCKNIDIWTWIQNLPPLHQWKNNTISTCICSSNSSISSPNLSLSITRNVPTQSVTLSIFASFNLPLTLWTSKPLHPSPTSQNFLDEESTTYQLISNLIQDVLKYSSTKHHHYPTKLPTINPTTLLKDFLNFSFLTLAFLVCIYEAPNDLRSNCLITLKDQLMTLQSRVTSKHLMRYLGSNIEEQWMRCLSLAVTNWKMELKGMNLILKGRCPLFTYSFSTKGLWKVQVYCPIITMEVENSSHSNVDEHLAFSLNYHQLEGVIQLNPIVTIREKWIDVNVNVDNLRLDVVRLVNETLLNERGAGASEKHFPSSISVQLTPSCQTNIIGVTVTKSSNNPETGIEIEKSLEFSFDPPKSVGIQMTAGETSSTTFKPWKFEQTAVGNTARLNWSLYDSNGGREVFSSKPSPIKLIQPKAWFRHRYSNVDRPFTRHGGVVFARDEYGQSVCWRVDKGAVGKKLVWEICGCVGLTYWPNKFRTFYNETRKAEFSETLELVLG